MHRPNQGWRSTLTPGDLEVLAQVPEFTALLAELGYPPTPRLRHLGPVEAPTPAALALARGSTDPEDSVQRGREVFPTGYRDGLRHLARPLHSGTHRGAVLELLALPQATPSVFAAMHALHLPGDAEVSAALARWAEARGVDPEAAATLGAP